MKKSLMLIAAFILAFGPAARSYADWKSYAWTYNYQTMRKDTAEIEYYLTEEQAKIDDSSQSIWKHQLELEYGITDNLDISMYQMFIQSNTAEANKFEYDGFKLRTRYRFLEKNELPVDTLLYLEYIRNDNLEKPNVLEGKLVLAKDIAKFNVAYNQVIKQELESGGKTEHAFAAGINYRIIPMSIGMESKGNYTAGKYYVGPTLSWVTDKLWVTIGALGGLNGKSDDLQTRMIMGILF
ncbi:MAG: hypothetical protein ABIJ53_06065 [Verrucomicrobiota bacterium]